MPLTVEPRCCDDRKTFSDLFEFLFLSHADTGDCPEPKGTSGRK